MTFINRPTKSNPSIRFYLSTITTFVVVCAVAFIAWRFSLQGETKSEISQPIKSSIAEPAPNSAQIKTEPAQQEDVNISKLMKKYSGDLGGLQARERKRGYFTAEENRSYEAYSDAVLEELCKNGDILAHDTLATRFIDKRDSKTAIAHLWQSATLGSTFAFISLANLSAPVFYDNLSAEEERSARRAATIESMAILKVGELRGDERLRRLMTGPLSAYQYRYGPIDLTADELQKINQRGQQLYDELQAKRLEMGLGPFDNSSPRRE